MARRNLSPAASRAATALSCCGPTISAGFATRLHRFRRPELEQFAIDLPDAGPQWWPIGVLSNFPRSLCPRRVTPTGMRSYHHAAGRELCARRGTTRLRGGRVDFCEDLDGISEKLPYLKQLGVTALYLNPVFAAPACINTIPRIIGASIRSLAATRRCCAGSGRECA